MLERLVAGVVVIGLLLWGASIIATPDADPFSEGEATDPAPAKHGSKDPVDIDPSPGDPPDDDDDDDEREERKRKRGRKGDG